MTVRELREKLAEFPNNMEVFLDRTTDFKYGSAENVYSKKINFKEDPDDKVLATDKVVIISEDF